MICWLQIFLASRYCVGTATLSHVLTIITRLKTRLRLKTQISSTLLKGMFARCACPAPRHPRAYATMNFKQILNTHFNLPIDGSLRSWYVNVARQVRLVDSFTKSYKSPLLETTLATPPARSERHHPTRRPAEAWSSRSFADILVAWQTSSPKNNLEGTCWIPRGCRHDD